MRYNSVINKYFGGKMKKLLGFLLIFMTLFVVTGCSLDMVIGNQGSNVGDIQNEQEVVEVQGLIEEDQTYYTVDDVALYINTYGKLPPNYLTKLEALKLGWESSKGNLWEATDKGVIGGDRFGNYEGILPDEEGRKWFECDVNYEGGFRGAERIVYSNDGLIYYTKDHYETFVKLY